MGYYIETPVHLGKAKYLVDHHNAELVLSPEDFKFDGDEALVCVVENGPFDAAGVAYDAAERDSFNNPTDPRAKTWLKITKKLALELQPALKYQWGTPTGEYAKRS